MKNEKLSDHEGPGELRELGFILMLSMFQGVKQGRDVINLHYRQIILTAMCSPGERVRR